MPSEVNPDDLKWAMKHYGFKIYFKKTGKEVKDLSAIGFRKLAQKYGIDQIDSELVHYSNDGDLIRAVVKSCVYFDGKRFTSLADADTTSASVRSEDMVVRATDTLAMKRAISRALSIDREELQEYEIPIDREEEEPYTEAPTESGSGSKTEEETEEEEFDPDEILNELED